ncbi:RND-type multidrug efflux system, inner membrane transporter MexD [Pseudomonas syringae pv. aptata]|uniref:RND-type multidrug efflux system, inner membrane transporter MexD n=1 Tax=Pseudomonas syringae pv. aptata TaxID=83167 RepID=A0A3M5WHL7_PSEAP|nr:RND-type multidrug efflux system, inner membrane transporter MexD [Pseudomonas syringae pv. aptata]
MVDKDEARPSCETARYRYSVEFDMSLSSGLIAAVALTYMAIMFAIAFYGDRYSASLRPTMRAWVYSLSLAVYCTSWTFFGAVGQAAEQLWSFLPIYLGPIVLMVLAPWVLQKMVLISKQENITSIADFIAARYGKSQSLAVMVALICLIGMLPYIALQLKGIVLGVNILIGAVADSTGTRAQDTALVVSLILALFTIVFGARNLDVTEHHRGMVLAIGILVDDAIVVVENVERIMAEEGLSPAAATVKAMQQVSGAIFGITLVLAAVFLPLAFMGGSVGVIYQQFSLSLAVSILFSGFLALTFTPALCATLLKPIPAGHHEKRGFFGGFNRLFGTFTDRYERVSSSMIKRAGRYMLLYLGIVGLLGFFYLRLPESFVPVEDQGYLIIDVQLPPGATRSRTDLTAQLLENYMLSREATGAVTMLLGFSFSGMGENAGLAFPTLKDWSERGKGQSAAEEAAAFNQHFAGLGDGTVMAVTPPPIDGLGTSGGFSLRLQDRAGLGREALLAARDKLLGEANGNPKILYAMMEGLAEAPQLRLNIDREKARALGVSFESISNALSTAFGSSVISDFANAGRQQRVVVQAEQSSRMTPESVLKLYVPNSSGTLVPLGAFVSTHWEQGPVQIARYNGYPAFRISGDAAPGVSTGEAMAEIERIVSELPQGIGYEWTGLSYQERLASGQAVGLFGLALLVVFLLLVALYESWAIPLVVMLIVPVGALGSVLAVTAVGMPNDVYFKVGLITIIGLAAKNAILIVEFAKELWDQGHSLRDAALQAARLRFRPIVMTSLAFILGVVPLTLATGAGAASQRAIGTGVIGGMLSATLLGVVLVPIFFVWVLSALRRKPHAQQIADDQQLSEK